MKKMNYNILLALAIFLLCTWIALLIQPLGSGQIYNENATVNTTVNITNSAPIVTDVALETPIFITPYGNVTVFCNVTVYDYDNDTVTVNATFYQDTIDPFATDHPNNHYSNISCSETGRYNTETNFTCGFEVEYYANNGTWYCNATALDDDNAIGNNESQFAIVQPTVAIVIPGIIDYGDLAQGEISPDIPANIINAGNRENNISVKGWGSAENDGLAMNCTFGNIDISYEKYNITNGTGNYAFMTELTQNLVMLPNFYIPQRTDPAQESTNSTFWKLQIPVGAGGICNGKILFSASDKGN